MTRWYGLYCVIYLSSTSNQSSFLAWRHRWTLFQVTAGRIRHGLVQKCVHKIIHNWRFDGEHDVFDRRSHSISTGFPNQPALNTVSATISGWLLLRPEQEKLLARLTPHSNAWLAVWGHQGLCLTVKDGMGKVLVWNEHKDRKCDCVDVAVYLPTCRCFMFLMLFACVLCHVGWNLFYSKSSKLWVLFHLSDMLMTSGSRCVAIWNPGKQEKDLVTWLSPAFLISIDLLYTCSSWPGE